MDLAEKGFIFLYTPLNSTVLTASTRYIQQSIEAKSFRGSIKSYLQERSID
jgi:hypothetical protein